MPAFKVVLQVVLPQPLTAEGTHLGGFYVSRHIVAENSDAAGEAAITMLNGEAKYQAILSQSPDDPIVQLDATEALDGPVDEAVNATGYVFYPLKPQPSSFSAKRLLSLAIVLLLVSVMWWWLNTVL